MEKTGDVDTFIEGALEVLDEDFIYNVTIVNQQNDIVGIVTWGSRDQYLYTGIPTLGFPAYPIAVLFQPTTRKQSTSNAYITCDPDNENGAIGISYQPVEIKNKTSFNTAFLINVNEIFFEFDNKEKEWKFIQWNVETGSDDIV